MIFFLIYYCSAFFFFFEWGGKGSNDENQTLFLRFVLLVHRSSTTAELSGSTHAFDSYRAVGKYALREQPRNYTKLDRARQSEGTPKTRDKNERRVYRSIDSTYLLCTIRSGLEISGEGQATAGISFFQNNDSSLAHVRCTVWFIRKSVWLFKRRHRHKKSVFLTTVSSMRPSVRHYHIHRTYIHSQGATRMPGWWCKTATRRSTA